MPLLTIILSFLVVTGPPFCGLDTRAREERLELGGEKEDRKRGDTGGCLCVDVCASVNGKGGCVQNGNL